MNLKDALVINNSARKSSSHVAVFLATGFTPLTLPHFLAAHLSMLLQGCRVDVSTGVFGDLAGNINRIAQSRPDYAAICVEWEDLDPRLGMRRLATATFRDFPGILAQAKSSKDILVSRALAVASLGRLAVSLPHLPLPPLSYAPVHLIHEFEAELRLTVAEMQVELARHKAVGLVRHDASPCFDLSATLHSGFPYTTEHASALGESLAKALIAAKPKKGIIVDLDETLWKGILGDDGVDGVHWDLDHQAQHHALFQRFLHAVAVEGTLVAIASKNSPEAAREIFSSRSDLLLKVENVFPIEINWQAKSKSVARILHAWNISADAVIFVDDSPLELAEVEAEHPGISCIRFPGNDLKQFNIFLQELRELLAKDKVGEEDAFRAESLRARAVEFSDPRDKADSEGLLRDLQAELSFDLGTDSKDERALELVNKTNQFNINGLRVDEPFWRKALTRPGAFLLTCSYKDKFGPLGKIAVLMGLVHAERIAVEAWVMSCRAFGRRIEFACVQRLFEAFLVDQISIDYRRTERNGPVKDMLESLGLAPQDGEVLLSKEQFRSKAPALYHKASGSPMKPEVATHA